MVDIKNLSEPIRELIKKQAQKIEILFKRITEGGFDRALFQGLNINVRDKNGLTPLMVAVDKGHVDVVNELIKLDADVNQSWKDGGTPLYIAAQQGHKKIIEILLAAKVDVNKAIYDGATPLYIAAQNGHKDIVEQLLEAGADIYHKDHSGTMVKDRSFIDKKIKKLIDQQDNKIKRLLTKIANGEYDNGLVKKLGVNIRNEFGATLLYIAAGKGYGNIVEQLLEAEADVNKAESSIGSTPLHIAAQEGKDDVVQQLIEAGADVNKDSDNGVTPLCIAALKDTNM